MQKEPASVHSLPRELLEAIFLYFFPSPSWFGCNLEEAVVQRTRLRSVCRQWNNIISSSNRLGCTLVNICGEERTLGRHPQSQGAPLMICCGHVVPWGVRCELGNVQPPPQFGLEDPASPYAQWRSLNICSRVLSWLGPSLLQGDTFPALVRACIRPDSGMDLDITPLQNLHHVRLLRLLNCDSILRPVPSLPHLTFLALYDTGLSGEPLINLLQALPNLRQLLYSKPRDSEADWDMRSAMPPQTPPLAHLEMLFIRNAELSIIRDILGTVPPDRKLRYLEIIGGNVLGEMMQGGITDDDSYSFPREVLGYLFNHPLVLSLVTDKALLLVDCCDGCTRLTGPGVLVNVTCLDDEHEYNFQVMLAQMPTKSGGGYGAGWPAVFRSVPISLRMWAPNAPGQDKLLIQDFLPLMPNNVVELCPSELLGTYWDADRTAICVLAARPEVLPGLRKIHIGLQCLRDQHCGVVLRHLKRARPHLQLVVKQFPHERVNQS